jgi:hypothetical protein
MQRFSTNFLAAAISFLILALCLLPQKSVVRADDDINDSDLDRPDTYVDDLEHCDDPFADDLPIACNTTDWKWILDDLLNDNGEPPQNCQELSASDWRFISNRSKLPNEWEPCKLWLRTVYNSDTYEGSFVVATVEPTESPTSFLKDDDEGNGGKSKNLHDVNFSLIR